MAISVSIIIPLYKGEKYIVKCLDSIKQQNCTDLDVVIVNDESPDKSVDIINDYIKNNTSNLSIRVINQSNQGQGAARNTGIHEASGEYLMFVDQDDTLESGILPKLLNKAVDSNADIVLCGYRRVTADGKTKQKVKLQLTEWSKYKVIAPWAKLYRTEFIKENNISFLPVVLGEDIYFLMQAYSYKPKVDFLENIGYNWLDNANSVSNTAHKELEEDTSLLKLYEMLETLDNCKVLKQDKLYEYFLLKTAIWDILYTARSNSYRTVIANNEKIWEWFDKHFEHYAENPYIKISRPQGESISIRMIVWGYMKLKLWGLDKLFLRLLSK